MSFLFVNVFMSPFGRAICHDDGGDGGDGGGDSGGGDSGDTGSSDSGGGYSSDSGDGGNDNGGVDSSSPTGNTDDNTDTSATTDSSDHTDDQNSYDVGTDTSIGVSGSVAGYNTSGDPSSADYQNTFDDGSMANTGAFSGTSGAISQGSTDWTGANTSANAALGGSLGGTVGLNSDVAGALASMTGVGTVTTDVTDNMSFGSLGSVDNIGISESNGYSVGFDFGNVSYTGLIGSLATGNWMGAALSAGKGVTVDNTTSYTVTGSDNLGGLFGDTGAGTAAFGGTASGSGTFGNNSAGNTDNSGGSESGGLNSDSSASGSGGSGNIGNGTVAVQQSNNTVTSTASSGVSLGLVVSALFAIIGS